MMEEEPPMGEIVAIQSFMPSSEYIRKISVLTVETLEDVNSSKLGVIEWSEACKTCDGFLDDCDGHFGSIELPVPCYRVFFMHYLLDILSSICYYCQNVRLPKTDRAYHWILGLAPEDRLSHWVYHGKYYKTCGKPQEIQKSCNYKSCCGKPFIKFEYEDRDAIFIKAIIPLEEKDFYTWKNDPTWQPLRITPQNLFDCLSNISPETKEMLGVIEDLNDPASTMWDVLPCSSQNTRPSHTFSNVGVKKKSFNDWTKLQRNIVGARNDLRDELELNPTEIINIAVYSVSNIQSKEVSECFLHGYAGKDVRDVVKKELKAKQGLRTIGPVEAAWRKLNKQIAAFHSAKHKKFANNGNVYGKPPMGVESRFKNQKMGRFRGTVTARRVDHAMRGVLEGCLHIRPDQIIIPLQRAMLQTYDEYVTCFNLKQVHEWILNGPFVYPGANFVKMKDGMEIDLMYFENRRDIDLSQVLIVKRHLQNGDIFLVNRQPTLHKNSMFGVYGVIMPDIYVLKLHHSVFDGLGADCDGDEIVAHIIQTPQARAEIASLCMVKDCIMKSGKIWVKFIQNTVVAAYLMTRPGFTLSRYEMIEIVSELDAYEFPEACELDRYSGHSIISLILPKDFTMEYKDETNHVLIHNGKLLKGQLNEKLLNGSNGILNHMYRDYADKEIIIQFIHQGYLLFQKFIENFGLTAGYYDGAIDLRDIDRYTNTIPDNFENKHCRNMSTIFQKMDNTKKCVIALKNYSDNFPQHSPISGSSDLEDNIIKHIDVINKMSCDQINEYHEEQDRNHMNGILHMIKSGSKGSATTLNSIGGRVTQVYVIYKRFGLISSHFLKSHNTLHAFGFLDENYSTGISLPSAIIEAHAACESIVGKNKGTSKSGYTVRKLTTCMMGIVVDRQSRAIDTNGRVLWNKYGNDGYDSQTLTDVTLRKKTPITTISISGNKKSKSEYTEEEHLAHLNSNVTNCNRTFRAPFKFEHLFLCCKIQLQTITPTMLPRQDYFIFISKFWDRLVLERLVLDSHALLKLLFFEWMGSENMIACKFGKEHLIWLSSKIIIYLQRAIVHAGESVGTLGTQETGEPFSQMSLKTPHLSGKFRGIFSGTVRIASMVDGKFNNPTMTIYLKKSIVSKQEATLFGLTILRCKLDDILERFPEYKISDTGICIRFVFNRIRTIARAISVREVARNLAINTNLELNCFRTSFADEAIWFLEVDVSYHSHLWISLVKQDEHVKQESNSDIGLIANVIVYNMYCNVYIHGFPSIENFVIDEVTIDNLKRWVITTLGSSLAKILSMPGVDVKRTTCNDCSEICAVLGVQAARKSLEYEFSLIFKGITDSRHIKLIARMMASDLEIKGMKLKQAAKAIPMLQRAAFEQGPKTMSEYCALAERDDAHTICGAALANKLMNVGTGYYLDVRLQDVSVPKNIKNEFSEKVCDYVFSFKVDGLRLLLSFAHDRNSKKICNLQDRNGSIWSLPSGGILVDGIFAGTVLDGDLSYVKRPDGTLTNELCFVVHDILMSCGNNCSYLRYDQRIEIAREVVYNLGTFGGSSNLKDAANFTPIQMAADVRFALPMLRKQISRCMFHIGSFKFSITVKPLFDLRGLALFDKYMTQHLQFPVDGYVLTSLSLGATPFTVNEAMAFKLKKDHTIDVILCKPRQNLKYANLPEKISKFQTSIGKYVMCAITTSINKIKEMAIFSHIDTLGEIQEMGCYECHWAQDSHWEVLKKRDKQANAMTTIVKTVTNILEDITNSEIVELIH